MSLKKASRLVEGSRFQGFCLERPRVWGIRSLRAWGFGGVEERLRVMDLPKGPIVVPLWEYLIEF